MWDGLLVDMLCRLRLHILKGLGFEPVLDTKNRLEKMIVREWAPFLASCIVSTGRV